MTGLERLRNVANAMRGYTVHGGGPLDLELMGIADRIERETAYDHSKEVSMSAYDLLPEEDRKAIAWVREKGGVNALSMGFQDADNRRIELCSSLGIDLATGWADAMAAMRRRLMPEGMEWPKVDGKPVDFKTAYRPSLGVLEAVSIYNNGACQVMSHDGIIKSAKDIHIVKPKVLDADGVEIRVGDTVYAPQYCDVRCTVMEIDFETDGYLVEVENEGGKKFRETPDVFTHRAPAIAADGKPLRAGETVFTVNLGIEGVVERIERQESDTIVHVRFIGDNDCAMREPSDITHERDSWERLEDDADALLKAESNGKGSYNAANDYCNAHGLGTDGTVWVLMARDLVRRAKKLAERGA